MFKKIFFLLFAVAINIGAIAQLPTLKVVYGKQNKTLNLADENYKAPVYYMTKKVLNSKSTLTISLQNVKIDKDKNRSYVLTDANNTQEIYKTDKAIAITTIFLNTIKSKFEKGKRYKLYTYAIPKDPKKAALVKVRRILVCEIEIV